VISAWGLQSVLAVDFPACRVHQLLLVKGNGAIARLRLLVFLQDALMQSVAAAGVLLHCSGCKLDCWQSLVCFSRLALEIYKVHLDQLGSGYHMYSSWVTALRVTAVLPRNPI